MKFKRFRKPNETHRVKDTAMSGDDVDPLTRYLDGIGDTIGRILLNRHIDDEVIKKFDLKKVKTVGRYYTAKILGLRGKLLDEVLIDRQTGRIHSVQGITSAGS